MHVQYRTGLGPVHSRIVVLLPGHVNGTDPLVVAEAVTREVIKGIIVLVTCFNFSISISVFYRLFSF